MPLLPEDTLLLRHSVGGCISPKPAQHAFIYTLTLLLGENIGSKRINAHFNPPFLQKKNTNVCQKILYTPLYFSSFSLVQFTTNLLIFTPPLSSQICFISALVKNHTLLGTAFFLSLLLPPSPSSSPIVCKHSSAMYHTLPFKKAHKHMRSCPLSSRAELYAYGADGLKTGWTVLHLLDKLPQCMLLLKWEDNVLF